MADSFLSRPPAGKARGPKFSWRLVGWSLAGVLLLTPLVAMQFTDEVQWTPGDFVVFGLMLAAAGILFDLVARTSVNGAYRLGVGLTVIGAFLLLWINLAVGIIGNESHPANLLFGVIIAMLGIGAALSRGRAAGMLRTLLVTAAAQVFIAVMTPLLGLGHITLISALFTGLWLLAAWSFRRSLRT